MNELLVQSEEIQSSGRDLPGDGGSEARDPGRPTQTYGVSCPACGGSLRIGEGDHSIRCRYCGAALYIAAPRGVRAWILRCCISSGAARLAALRYLSERTGGGIGARHASIVDQRLINVPFWRLSGRLSGWIGGERIERRVVETAVPGPNGTRIVHRTDEKRRPFSKLVCKRIDWSTPACTLRHLGLQGIALRMRMLEWEAFDHGMRETINIALPMKTATRARRDGNRYLAALAVPAGARVKASRFDLLGEDLSLYYFPVYIIRYRHKGRIHSITIDGNDGHVIRGDVPAPQHAASKTRFVVPAVTAFLAGTAPLLVPIAAVLLYLRDAVSGGPPAPQRWLAWRLAAWFGGD